LSNSTSGRTRATRRFVREYFEAMRNVASGWCSDVETRRVVSVGMVDGVAAGKMRTKQTHAKAARKAS
jgi:hypothetical protein